jgi:hypothetical protein
MTRLVCFAFAVFSAAGIALITCLRISAVLRVLRSTHSARSLKAFTGRVRFLHYGISAICFCFVQ